MTPCASMSLIYCRRTTSFSGDSCLTGAEQGAPSVLMYCFVVPALKFLMLTDSIISPKNGAEL